MVLVFLKGKLVKKTLLIAVAILGCIPGLAHAQTSPSSTWNDSVGWRSPSDRAVDLERARTQQQARSGGFGPAQVVYNGDVTNNDYNTYNGAVVSNQATTATNLNSFSSTMNQTGGNSATVTFTTGNTAYNTSQNATASNASSGNGAATNAIDSSN
jgi:hypothetical protein